MEMKKIIMSIKPKYAKLLRTRQKIWEVRKKIPKDHHLLVYVYESSPVQRITFRFTLNGDSGNLDVKYLDGIHFDYRQIGLTREETIKYLGDGKGWFLSPDEMIVYENPVPITNPPQNYRYITEEEIQLCKKMNPQK